MASVSFSVAGIPKPAGSKKAFRHAVTGKIIVTDASGKPGRDWRACVGDNASVAMLGREPMRGPIRLEMVFTVPRPKSHYRTDGHTVRANAPAYPTTKPDATKLLRSAEDALKGIVWADDSQVVEQHVVKFYGPPGVSILVEEME